MDRRATSLNKIIADKLRSLIQTYESENAVVFLKGFSIDYYNDLLKSYNNLYYEISSDEKLNLLDITANKRKLMRSMMNVENAFVIGLYEEMLVLGESISDLTDAPIVVIENNYYDGFFPAEYNAQTMHVLEEMMASIENELLDDMEYGQLSEIISGVQVVDGELFISFMDLKDQVVHTKIKLFDVSDATIDISEINEDIIFDNYYIENPQEICRLKRDLETNRLNTFEINIKVESSMGSKKRISESLQPISMAYPDISLKLFFEDRLTPVQVKDEFVNILNQYWETDSFREIDFYEKPDINLNKIKLSQGTIIQTIVDQVENAIRHNKFQDVFVTAPTGAGKSMLYQMPAIYLAQEYGLITIVISPLKSLMLDQVRQLKERGVDFVEYINSDLSQIQKQDILESIQKRKTSILYVSPEFLLAYDIRALVGNTRKIGLIVVDEAHLVTTWGRDFRIDYWYLGSYIKKLRDNRYKGSSDPFVVAAFTATAVYGGNDDMVFETIASLNMLNPIKFLGNTRRDNIGFKISTWDKRQSYEEERLRLTLGRIKELVSRNRKTIVYAPYRRHINEIADQIDSNYSNKVVKYHAGLDREYKEYFEEQFRNGKATLMLATKAFGMGVDISDIEIVYHHAPTGNLCDYIQEIGRAGRIPSIKAYAVQDFNEKHDLHYAKILYGLSGMRQYQLREVLKKLYRIYCQEGRRNFLVNAESFRYIFNNESDYESKLKNALLLLEKDLEPKYGYPIIIVRPKSLFSKAYAAISNDILDEFLASPYAVYVKMLANNASNEQIIGTGSRSMNIKDVGPIYEINLKRLWEDKFANISFPQLKRAFYERQLFEGNFKDRIYPRYRLILRFTTNDPEEIMQEYNKHINIIIEFFTGRNSFFKKDSLRQYLKEQGYPEVERRKIANAIIDLFVIKQEVENRDAFLQKRNSDKKSWDSEESVEYRVANLNYLRVFNETGKRLANLLHNINSTGEISQYLAVKRSDPNMNLAYILEAYSMGSYEVKGGESPEIFIRINDPYRISTLVANDKAYSNTILRDIKDRQERSFGILRHFFVSLNDDEERWDFVENYFLGRITLDG
jgi:ATP-dependent DNA helicase RecQ